MSAPALRFEPTDRPARERELAARIRSRRQDLGLSIETAANRYAASTGLSLTRQGWSYWETHGCSLAQIDAVAAVLSTSAAALLGFE